VTAASRSIFAESAPDKLAARDDEVTDASQRASRRPPNSSRMPRVTSSPSAPFPRPPAGRSGPTIHYRFIESTFSIVRLRTRVTKGPDSRSADLILANTVLRQRGPMASGNGPTSRPSSARMRRSERGCWSSRIERLNFRRRSRGPGGSTTFADSSPADPVRWARSLMGGLSEGARQLSHQPT